MSLQNVPGLDGILPNIPKPEFSSKNSTRMHIKNLVKSTLIETVSLVFLSKVISFSSVSTSTSSGITKLILSIGTASMICKSIRCYLQYGHSQQHNNTSKCLTSSLLSFNMINQWILPLNFAILWGTTGNLLIHEVGHVAMAFLVYKNLQAYITIPSMYKASVSWTKTGLTPFGSLLGDFNSRLLVCMAGPLTAVLTGTVGLVVAKVFKDRFPDLSKHLIVSAVFTIAYQALYAFSALWASQADLGHDFVMLWHVGVHPAIASILLVIIPTMALATYQILRTGDHNNV